MAITSYGELKSAISNWTERNDSAFTTRVPEFIELCEAENRRRVRTRNLLTRAQATTTAGTRYLSLPAGFLGMRTLRLLTNPVQRLEQVSLDEMTDSLYTTSNGKPTYFAVHEEIEFNRPPDSTYTVEMIYWKEVDALSDGNPTNVLFDNHPDLYLFGSLIHAYDWMQSPEHVAMYTEKYSNALASIHQYDKRDQWSQGGLTRRPRLRKVY